MHSLPFTAPLSLRMRIAMLGLVHRTGYGRNARGESREFKLHEHRDGAQLDIVK